LDYSSHRLAVQAGIEQNRSIFPTRSKLPRIIAINGTFDPPARLAQRGLVPAGGHARKTLAILKRQIHHLRATGPITGRRLRAQSLWWDKVGRLPPANQLADASVSLANQCCPAHTEMAHPKDSFDKTGQRTLGRSNSLAGRIDCNASNSRSDRSERSVCSDVRHFGALQARCAIFCK
jgi:hypothetical protein